jgi:hypothetical protein
MGEFQHFVEIYGGAWHFYSSMQQRMFNWLRTRLRRVTAPSVILLVSLLGLQSAVLGYHQGYHASEQVAYASSVELSAAPSAGLSDLGCTFCTLINVSTHHRNFAPRFVFQTNVTYFEDRLAPFGLSPKIYSLHQPRGPPVSSLISFV